MVNRNIHDLNPEIECFRDQVGQAFQFETEDSSPSNSEFIFHFLTFYWKVLCSLLPLKQTWHGGALFFMSLVLLAVITAFTGDLAKMFGCCLGFHSGITAITFVALGTSLPDTFASRTAALHDEYADNSIGNVTGSNSVNVFLGLGLPLVAGSIYKGVRGERYYYMSEGLFESVTIYLILAVITLGLLVWRRF